VTTRIHTRTASVLGSVKPKKNFASGRNTKGTEHQPCCDAENDPACQRTVADSQGVDACADSKSGYKASRLNGECGKRHKADEAIAEKRLAAHRQPRKHGWREQHAQKRGALGQTAFLDQTDAGTQHTPDQGQSR
jgi:hypothetical protein